MPPPSGTLKVNFDVVIIEKLSMASDVVVMI
jgi:hypothetical protein